MIAVALKGLAGRKVRALLTALRGGHRRTMVSGTFVLTDTIQKAFDGIFTASNEQTDAVVTGKEIVKAPRAGAATIPERCSPRCGRCPGRGGRRHDRAEPVQPRRVSAATARPSAPQARPSSGSAYDASLPQFSPLKLKTGEWPEGPQQVAIDAGTAAEQKFKVGDTIARVRRSAPRSHYKLTGVATFGSVDSLGGASIAIFDLPTAQALLDKEGQFDSISVEAKDGDLPRRAHRRPSQQLVPASVEVKTGDARPRRTPRRPTRVLNVHPLLPARLRRYRAVRGRVRDLQHAVDHGRPAHARVRDAADARGLALAGHALGGDRRPGGRAARLGDRARRSGSGSPRACALFAAIGRRPARRPEVFAPARSSSRTRSAPSSRCWRASCPRGARRACRRSPRSARARRCPPRASPPTAKTAVGVIVGFRGRHLLGIFAAGWHVAVAAAARRRRARAVPRRRLARAAPGQAARPASWPAPARRGGGIAGDLASENSVRNPAARPRPPPR